MAPMYEVTVHLQGKDILGRPVPRGGALETRTYAARSEEHAREVAQAALLPSEEIVSVTNQGDHDDE